MSSKVWILKLSLNLSSGIRRWLAFGLAFCALSGVGNPLVIKFVSAQAQDQNRVAAQSKFDEGEALQKQRTAESLCPFGRMAVSVRQRGLTDGS